MDYIKESVNIMIGTIAKYKQQAEMQGTQMGIIQGEYVVANGSQYNFNSLADKYLEDGTVVTVSIDQNTGQAVILG